MIDRALGWIDRHSVPGQGIVVHSGMATCYPEVTGYFIPTLLALGRRELARRYAAWLVSVQRPDGAFAGPGSDTPFAFDTGQVVRGWVALVPEMPELEAPLRRACDWLVASADPVTGRLPVPPAGGAWSLGRRGEVSEGIHLYVLGPLERAGALLDEARYRTAARRALDHYLAGVPLTDFERPEALTHFFAYVQEALVELGCAEMAARGMAAVARHQQDNGAVPGYHDAPWVCSPGLAQLAQVWYLLGEHERAERAMGFLGQLQNPSGGFFGSLGVGADYFPAVEVSWAVKYAVEATQRQIAAHFDRTTHLYPPTIPETDGRAQAVLRHLGELDGKAVLDAGAGKGRYVALLRDRFPRARLTAMDVSAQMLAHVPPGIRTVQSSILATPFADGEFDAVICIEALEHAVDTAGAVRELARVLAPGGRLLIIDKNAERLGALAMPAWERWFDRHELLGRLETAGLSGVVEAIAYEERTAPDGLFLCWVGTKPSPAAAGPAAASHAPSGDGRRPAGAAPPSVALAPRASEAARGPAPEPPVAAFGARHATVQRLLRSSRTIVDLGGGPSPVAGATAAVDRIAAPSEHALGPGSAIDPAALGRRGIRFVNQRIDEPLPFADKEFDLAYSAHAFEHLDDPATACREMMRVARAGVVITPSPFAELLFGRPHHRWLVFDRCGVLFFLRKRAEEEQPFGEHPELRSFSRSPVMETIFVWRDRFAFQVLDEAPAPDDGVPAAAGPIALALRATSP